MIRLLVFRGKVLIWVRVGPVGFGKMGLLWIVGIIEVNGLFPSSLIIQKELKVGCRTSEIVFFNQQTSYLRHIEASHPLPFSSKIEV